METIYKQINTNFNTSFEEKQNSFNFKALTMAALATGSTIGLLLVLFAK